MSSRDISGEISQIDSFLKQLRGEALPPSKKEPDEFQQAPPVPTTASPHGNSVAWNSGTFDATFVSCCMS